jgi:hypothetical protein
MSEPQICVRFLKAADKAFDRRPALGLLVITAVVEFVLTHCGHLFLAFDLEEGPAHSSHRVNVSHRFAGGRRYSTSRQLLGLFGQAGVALSLKCIEQRRNGLCEGLRCVSIPPANTLPLRPSTTPHRLAAASAAFVRSPARRASSSATKARMPIVRRLTFGLSAATKSMPDFESPSTKYASRASRESVATTNVASCRLQTERAFSNCGRRRLLVPHSISVNSAIATAPRPAAN